MRSSCMVHRHGTARWVLTLVISIVVSVTPSHAKVIYKNMYVSMTNQGTYNYDFNSDGVVDLTFALKLLQNGCGYVITASETPAHDAGTMGMPPEPLQAGDQIGPNQEFAALTQTMASLTWNHCGQSVIYGGPWPKSAVRYLGISFLINGETHYAWATVEFVVVVTFGPPKLVAKLTGFAYETTPGMSINAGQTQ